MSALRFRRAADHAHELHPMSLADRAEWLQPASPAIAPTGCIWPWRIAPTSCICPGDRVDQLLPGARAIASISTRMPAMPDCTVIRAGMTGEPLKNSA